MTSSTDILAALQSASHSVKSLYSKLCNEHELTVVELDTLNALCAEENLTASALAAKVGRLPTSFTPILDSLERKGWILRVKDLRDRRAIQVRLSDKSRQKKSVIKREFQNIEQSINAKINDADLSRT